MRKAMKAKIAAILSGSILVLSGGASGSVVFTYPDPANCSAISIAASGTISCTGASTVQQTKFTFAGPISCSGLVISATGAVSCAKLPEGCTLTASPTTAAPGDTITLTASGCTQSPDAYSWGGGGLPANSTTAQNTTQVAIPASASAGPSPYSVIAANATGSGPTVGTTINVAIPGYTGPFAYIAHQVDPGPAPGILSVVDTTNMTASAVNVSVGVYPVGVAVNAAGTRVYVTNSGSYTVSVIDTATNQVVQVYDPSTNTLSSGIAVNKDPWGIAVNPSGTKVYVANSGSGNVSVIDAASNLVTATVPVGNTPYGVAVNPAGSKIYVTNYAGNSVSVINAANDTVEYLAAINNQPFNKPFGVAVNPNGTQVYVANEGGGTVSVIDTSNDTVVNTVKVGNSPRGVAVNPAGTQVYVVNSGDRTVSVIDVTSAASYPVTTMEGMGELPNFIAFNPAGTLAYVTNLGGDLSAIDVAANDLSPSAVPVGAGLYSFGNFIGSAIGSAGAVAAQGVVSEFYNTILDHYFITADVNAAASLVVAGSGWTSTGNSFKSGGNTPVCRFYGSYLPGPNSHFYTVDPGECQELKDQQIPTGDPRKLTDKSWNFEFPDFFSTPPINQTCSGGTQPVYRAYNNGFSRGVDSNHRITSSLSAIQEVVARGWSYEGVVMCAPN